MVSLHYLTITQASELIGKGKLSPVELTRAHLGRIEALNDRLHAFITVTGDLALKEATEAERAIQHGDYRGPLHGIPVAHKDMYATKGVLTTAHSRVLLDWAPEEDATAVARLKHAGTVLLGKLAMHEFANGGPTHKPFPAARNPWHVDYMPGGSSSGSAVAVAAGLCLGSLGVDLGGAIRNPASLCGIVGLKPTYGRVSRHRLVTASWSWDTCGPVTRTVQDAALMLQAIAGPDPLDPSTSQAPVPDYSKALDKGIKGVVLGLPRRHFFDPQRVEKETLRAVEEAIRTLEEMGAKTRVVDLPSLQYENTAFVCIKESEVYANHEATVKRRHQDYGTDALRNIHAGAMYSAADYIQAQRIRRLVKQEFDRVLTEVDALVTPTMSYPAERFDQHDAADAMVRPLSLPALHLHRASRHIGLLRVHVFGAANRPADCWQVFRRGYHSAHRP